MANKVRFGLKNVHYALVTNEGFGTPVALPGAVSLSLDPEGDSSTFYADNTAYATFTTNAGYTGEFELAALEDAAAAALLGEVADAIGGMYENADAQPAEFALLFEIAGNVKNQRFALYSCTVARPSREANTTTDSTDPDTITLSFTAVPKEMTLGSEAVNVTKYTMELSATNATVYNAWFTEVKTPTVNAG